MKIFTQIFSFDRPAQLCLLLESINKYDKEKVLDVSIQYRCSGPAIHEGYEKLIAKHKNYCFIEEGSFSSPKLINPLHGYLYFNLLHWLSHKRYRYQKSDFRAILLKSLKNNPYPFIIFLTDDCLFYKDILINSEITRLISQHNSLSYSLALGKNIKGGCFTEMKDHLSWKYNDEHEGRRWRYPFSVDGVIYNSQLISKLVSKTEFANPSTFETLLVGLNKEKKVFVNGFANKESCIVGFELNCVQNTFINKQMGIDPIKMNDAFLKDFNLNIEFYRENVSDYRPEVLKVSMQKDGEPEIIFYSHP
jgi:hypothetical protein